MAATLSMGVSDTMPDKNSSYLVMGYFLRPTENTGDAYVVK